MLFVSLGQGYVFLLLLSLGIFFGICRFVAQVLPQALKNGLRRRAKKMRSVSPPKTEASPMKPIPTPPQVRKIEFPAPQKNKTKNHQKNTKKIKNKLSKNTKKITKNISQIVFGLLRMCVYGASMYWVVFLIDFGEIRAYHILAFLIGFWLTKAIFARLNCSKKFCDKI